MLNKAQAGAWLKAHRWFLAVLAVLLFIDRASKVWALEVLKGHPLVLGKYFWLDYVENTGAAFGMFQNGNLPLIAVMLLVIGYLVYSWKDFERYGKCAVWGAGLILCGALGNLYDRITLGFVVDFLDFRVWPVFNVADSLITIGAGLFAISLISKRTPKETK